MAARHATKDQNPTRQQVRGRDQHCCGQGFMSVPGPYGFAINICWAPPCTLHALTSQQQQGAWLVGWPPSSLILDSLAKPADKVQHGPCAGQGAAGSVGF